MYVINVKDNVVVETKSVGSHYVMHSGDELADEVVTLGMNKDPITGVFSEPVTSMVDIERKWQESELLRTDSMLQPDRPNAQAILDYRQELRAYNNHVDFPNGARPLKGVI